MSRAMSTARTSARSAPAACARLDELLRGGVTAGADGAHGLGDLDRAGDRAEGARAGEDGVGDEVRRIRPTGRRTRDPPRRRQVVLQREGAQVLEQPLLRAGSGGTACRLRRRLVPAMAATDAWTPSSATTAPGGAQQGIVVALDLEAPRGLPAVLHRHSLLRNESIRKARANCAERSLRTRKEMRSSWTKTRDRKIRRLVERLQATQSDVEPFLALHTPDTIIVNFGGLRRSRPRRRPQRDGGGAGLTSCPGDHDCGGRRHPLPRPDVAIVSATKHVFDQRDTTDTFATEGRLTYVVVEEDGDWRVALAQTTPWLGSERDAPNASSRRPARR